MPDELTQEQLDRISAELEAGYKVKATDIYRKATGKGLREAKYFIDDVVEEMIERDPERYAHLASEPRMSGCVEIIIAALILGAVLVWALR